MPSSPKVFHLARLDPRKSTVLVLGTCIVISFSGFFFGLTAIFSSSRYKCPSAEPRSVRVVWERGGGGGDGIFATDGLQYGKRHKVMGFVGIQTGFGSVGRRRSLRQTWMPSDRQGLQRLEEATGLAFRFVIGRTKDKSKMSELSREVAEYDDFMLLDTEERYSMLPYKTLAFFKAAYTFFDSEFYVKADDDIYLRPDRLSHLLANERNHSQTYIGCMKKGPVFTDPKLKWYEPMGHLLGREYFLHAYGPIYALSADVVASLVALKNYSFRMLSNEDVTIGAWMLAMNVNHKNEKALCQPECTPSSIAVWDIPKCSGLCQPEKKLLELHRKEACYKGLTLETGE
ncbi:hypothetical protein SAY87_012157 [Trapa incisa]|uniref:Hexosyltransferase n=2 Tax=Trapa TaxID=22665 RepID=A0AAN7RDC8_TRANT|nr:hypothetical protein SAY87_012157 [Trapa incisa]KAK4795796.1 hypothetical protein SAY86_028122 [Trapa natans]